MEKPVLVQLQWMLGVKLSSSFWCSLGSSNILLQTSQPLPTSGLTDTKGTHTQHMFKPYSTTTSSVPGSAQWAGRFNINPTPPLIWILSKECSYLLKMHKTGASCQSFCFFAYFKMVPSISLGSYPYSPRVATGFAYKFWRNLAFQVGAFSQQFSGVPTLMFVRAVMGTF